jgi:hypothetical protein
MGKTCIREYTCRSGQMYELFWVLLFWEFAIEPVIERLARYTKHRR